MSPIRIAGVVLVVLGVLALVFGGFTTTTEEHSAEVGPIAVEVEETREVEIPVWVGLVLVMSGVGLVLVGGRR